MTDELKPGRELDALVAERVMKWAPPRVSTKDVPPCPVKEFDYLNPPEALENWRSDFHWREDNGTCWHEPLNFSTNTTAAWQVVERLRDHPNGYTVTIKSYPNAVPIRGENGQAFRKTVVEVLRGWTCYVAESREAPHAICLAALKTVGAR